MVMIRTKDKASRIAQAILKNKGVKVQAGIKLEKTPPTTPYLQH